MSSRDSGGEGTWHHGDTINLRDLKASSTDLQLTAAYNTNNGETADSVVREE